MSHYGHGLLPKAGLVISKSSANVDLVPLGPLFILGHIPNLHPTCDFRHIGNHLAALVGYVDDNAHAEVNVFVKMACELSFFVPN